MLKDNCVYRIRNKDTGLFFAGCQKVKPSSKITGKPLKNGKLVTRFQWVEENNNRNPMRNMGAWELTIRSAIKNCPDESFGNCEIVKYMTKPVETESDVEFHSVLEEIAQGLVVDKLRYG